MKGELLLYKKSVTEKTLLIKTRNWSNLGWLLVVIFTKSKTPSKPQNSLQNISFNVLKCAINNFYFHCPMFLRHYLKKNNVKITSILVFNFNFDIT